MSVPGHKQRRDLTGDVTAGDAPLYGGLDAIKHADELLAEAERRAAQLWGADWCRFSVAGSTHGNQALALAVGEPGQADRGHPGAAPLAAARPGAGRPGPGVGAARGGPGHRAARPGPGRRGPRRAGPPPGRLRGVPRRPVLRRHHRRPGRPRGGRARGGGAAAGRRGLGRAPRLPPGAAAARAGGGRGRHGDQRTQGAARLHAGRAGAGPDGPPGPGWPGPGPPGPARPDPARLDPARLDRAFEATHTTSPAGAIMASIDAARALLARDGEELCARLLRVVGGREGPAAPRCPAWTCWTAREWSRPSWSSCSPGPARTATRWRRTSSPPGMPVEMADRDTIIPIVTLADDEAAVARFTATLAAIDRGAPRAAPAAGAGRVVDGHPGRGDAAAARPFFAATKPAPPPGPWAG